MIFQILDNKIECRGIYAKGEIHKEPFEGLTATWSYCDNLPLDVEYAELYCGGKSIEEVCPEQISDRWEYLNDRLRSHLRALTIGKIDLTEHCFYDLVPEHFLCEYYELKNKITQHVLDNIPKPDNYDHLLTLTKAVENIKKRELKIQTKNLAEHYASTQARSLIQKLSRRSTHRIEYNIHGTKTGRLTTERGSFPILTMNKKHRSIIEPTNDLFLELDFNAAEIRTLLALSGKSQPKGDIHNWNVKNVYSGSINREQAKERIFAWLYNPNSKDKASDNIYERDKVIKKYWDGTKVKTIYNREIESDHHHAMNYIIQSTTADLFLRQMNKVYKMLEGKKSFVSFFVHDSLVIDLDKEEKRLILPLVEEFSNTSLGKYKVNIALGKNYGEMKKLCI